ncbi:MAG: sugar phosphate isomerase/epimerase [Acidobacteria bacterium]|nr:sugar phosphate isomerase/epimerase [Acidobacteriota bacterium]MBI3658037.1 sugar phosphate isomerase/epimerase [Acidobacteriota bacterium]
MKLAFSTNAFVKVPLVMAMRLIGQVGYTGVEIMADKPHYFPPSARPEDLTAIQGALRQNQLMVSNVNANTATGFYTDPPPESFFEPSLANPQAAFRRWRVNYTKACLDFAKAIGAENVSVTSGRPLPGCPPDTGRAFLAESLRELLEHAAVLQVHLIIEYEPGLLLQDARSLLELLSRLNSPWLGVNLDLGHSYLAGEDPTWVIPAFGETLHNLHIEDIRGRDHFHLIPGLGDMDFHKIFDALQRIQYARFVTVELYSYPQNPEHAARASFDFLSAFFSQGKGRA